MLHALNVRKAKKIGEAVEEGYHKEGEVGVGMGMGGWYLIFVVGRFKFTNSGNSPPSQKKNTNPRTKVATRGDQFFFPVLKGAVNQGGKRPGNQHSDHLGRALVVNHVDIGPWRSSGRGLRGLWDVVNAVSHGP